MPTPERRERRARSLSPTPTRARKRDILWAVATGNSAKRSSSPRGLRINRKVSAHRDLQYLNVLATEDLVATDCILDSLELCQANRKITKLEVEDIMNRKTDREEILTALHSVLKKDKGRPWSGVQFTDCIRVLAHEIDADAQDSSRVMLKLCEYEDNQQELWEQIRKHSYDNIETRKPISFQVKIHLDEGASVDDLLKIMRLLHKSSLEKVEFGGALYGCSTEDISSKLGKLFLRIKNQNENEPDTAVTIEMIMLDLFYTLPHLSVKEPTGVLGACADKLTKMKQKLEAPPPSSDATDVATDPLARGRSSHRRNGVANMKLKKVKKNGTSGSPEGSTSGRVGRTSSGNKKLTAKVPEKQDSITAKPACERIPRSSKKDNRKPRRQMRRMTVSIEDAEANLKLLRKETPDFRWEKVKDYELVPRKSNATVAA